MSNKTREKYLEAVNIICEQFGLDKPPQIIYVCEAVDRLIEEYREEYRKENEELKKRCSDYAMQLKRFLKDEELSFMNCNPRSRLEILEENEKLKKQLEIAEQVASSNPGLFIQNCNLKAENNRLANEIVNTTDDVSTKVKELEEQLEAMKKDLFDTVNKDTQPERLQALWDMVHKYLYED